MYLILKAVGAAFLAVSLLALGATFAMLFVSWYEGPRDTESMAIAFVAAIPVIALWTGGMVAGCALYVGGHVLEYVQRRIAGMDAAWASAESELGAGA